MQAEKSYRGGLHYAYGSLLQHGPVGAEQVSHLSCCTRQGGAFVHTSIPSLSMICYSLIICFSCVLSLIFLKMCLSNDTFDSYLFTASQVNSDFQRANSSTLLSIRIQNGGPSFRLWFYYSNNFLPAANIFVSLTPKRQVTSLT